MKHSFITLLSVLLFPFLLCLRNSGSDFLAPAYRSPAPRQLLRTSLLKYATADDEEADAAVLLTQQTANIEKGPHNSSTTATATAATAHDKTSNSRTAGNIAADIARARAHGLTEALRSAGCKLRTKVRRAYLLLFIVRSFSNYSCVSITGDRWGPAAHILQRSDVKEDPSILGLVRPRCSSIPPYNERYLAEILCDLPACGM
jgi:hypothetical protein